MTSSFAPGSVEGVHAAVVTADIRIVSLPSVMFECPSYGVALQECYDFELAGCKTIRIKIFSIPRVGNTNSYPMRTGHVMFVEVDNNY